MPLIESSVGVQALADGTKTIGRSDRLGGLLVSELRGRYAEQALRGNLYSGSVVGQVTTVGLAATYTGLCLSNPLGSGKNLEVLKCGFSFIVAFAAGAHIGLMTGFNGSTNVTHTAAVTPRNRLFTGVTGTGAGLLDSSATLPTAPTVDQIFASGDTGAITTTPVVPATYVDLEGSLVLTPGAYCAFYTSTASGTAGGAFSFLWAEHAV